MRVLVVEDDGLVGDAVKRAIEEAGFAVDLVGTADLARTALQAESFDLLQGLRSRGETLPVLMLTARDALSDRVTALDLGADDYLTKPFHVPELVARCRALIRRSHAVSTSHVTLGALSIDLTHREVTANGAEVALTEREWAILECFVLNAGRLVSKTRLMSAIADADDALTPNAIEQYVSRLRTKLGDAANIRAVRGMGYRLDERAG